MQSLGARCSLKNQSHLESNHNPLKLLQGLEKKKNNANVFIILAITIVFRKNKISPMKLIFIPFTIIRLTNGRDANVNLCPPQPNLPLVLTVT